MNIKEGATSAAPLYIVANEPRSSAVFPAGSFLQAQGIGLGTHQDEARHPLAIDLHGLVNISSGRTQRPNSPYSAW